MSKLYISEMITIDGFFEGPNREIDWHNVDEEFNEYAVDQLDRTGVLVFGRVTYELMASYWPTELALTNDPIVAGRMNAMPKIVAFRSLANATWNNTTLIRENIAEEISRLKEQPGKDIGIFGSAELVATLLQSELIDEFRIFINPVILGKGNLFFHSISERVNLKLLRTDTFHTGNVLVCYQPVTKLEEGIGNRGQTWNCQCLSLNKSTSCPPKWASILKSEKQCLDSRWSSSRALYGAGMTN